MADVKTYIIGGKKFVLGNLTWIQKKTSSMFDKKLREKIVELYSLSKNNADVDIAQVFEISVKLDDMFYSDDRALLKFLATILTPEGRQFDISKIDEISIDMENIDEETLNKAMQDFFLRTRNFLILSKSEAAPSAPSEDSSSKSSN